MVLSPSSPSRCRFRSGELQRVVWLAWTGHNPMPAHLQICVKTIQRNSGLEVILVTPRNLAEYVPDPHPAYEHLHLAHRADYLRCYLLHHYGGIYVDCDSICLRRLDGLFDQLDQYDAVGYDGSIWGEYVGISVMGPFKPGTQLTALWFAALHGKLQQRMEEIEVKKTDVFYWQEILGDIFLPASLMYRDNISKALQALNPDKEQLWSLQPHNQVLGHLSDTHILIMNNAKYGAELGSLTEEQIMSGPAVLSQLLRMALGH